MLSFFLGVFLVHALGIVLLSWGWRRADRWAPLSSASGESLPEGPAHPRPPISLVMALRDEADRLPDVLAALDAQTHPDAEIVLVDDASTDGTAAHLQAWSSDRSHVRLVRITDPQPPRKKHALTKGIEAASHNLLAFTDADCTPPPAWLARLAEAHAATERETVLVGYSPMTGRGLLGAWARYETFVAGVYAVAAIGLNQPYLAVGRNLSYPRSVFEEVGGFNNILLSGDDDLFVQDAHHRNAADVRAVLHPETVVPTAAPDTWAAWIHQKRRHVSAGRQYHWQPSTALTLINGAGLVLWGAPLAVGMTGIGLLAAGLLLRQVLLGPAADRLHETALLALYPLGEGAYALYHLLLVPFGLLRPPSHWSSAWSSATAHDRSS